MSDVDGLLCNNIIFDGVGWAKVVGRDLLLLHISRCYCCRSWPISFSSSSSFILVVSSPQLFLFSSVACSQAARPSRHDGNSSGNPISSLLVETTATEHNIASAFLSSTPLGLTSDKVSHSTRFGGSPCAALRVYRPKASYLGN